MNKILYWTPRILAIIITIFWFLFTILSHGLSFVTVVESLIWVILLITTIIAWKYEQIGGIVFIILGLLYVFLAINNLTLITFILVSGPLIITGILFIINKYTKEKLFTTKKLKRK